MNKSQIMIKKANKSTNFITNKNLINVVDLRKKFLNIHEMIEFLYRYTLTSVLIKMSLSDL